MKNNFLKTITVLIFVFLCLSCLIGCGSGQNLVGKAKVVVDDGVNLQVVEVDFEDTGLKEENSVFELLIWLKENKNFALEYQTGDYGAFITAIDTIVSDGDSFISVFTSVETDFGTGAFVEEKQILGTKIASAGVGVSSLKLCDGAVYYFVLERISW